MSRLRLVHVGLIMAVLTAFVTWPQVLEIRNGVTDFGDPLLNAWALAWHGHAIASQPTRIFDANVFAPERLTLAYSETLLLPGWLLAPLSWFGAGPILLHNILLFCGYVLSGMAAFALVRRLTGHAGAALVAGVVFGLYPYRIEAYPKVQLQLVFWWPVALLALHALVDQQTWKRASALGAAVAAEFYTCVYFAIFGALAMGVVAAGLWVGAGRRRLALGGRLVVAGAIAVALTLPLVVVYQSASRIVGERGAAELEPGSAKPADYLRAHPENWLYGDDGHPGDGERRLFSGYLAPALSLAAFVPPVNTAAVAYLAAGAVAFDLSLGVNGPGYRTLYEWLPPLHALRVPARFGMFVGLVWSVLAGLGVARLCRNRSAAVQLAVVFVAVAGVTAESRMRPQALVHLDDAAPAVYRWLAAQPAGVVCEYPVGKLEGRAGPQDATYMVYSTTHWKPLVNGYSGFAPPSYAELLTRLADFPDDASVNYLRARGVTYLLVHEKFYIEGNYVADVKALRARSDIRWVGSFRWAGGEATDVFVIPH